MKRALLILIVQCSLLIIYCKGQWVKIGLDKMAVYTIAKKGTNIFAGTDSGVFISTNNGISWITKNNGLSSIYVYSLIIKEDKIFAGTFGGVFLSTNEGNNWKAMNTGLTNIFDSLYVNTLATDGENIYAGNNSGLFISTNNGSNWNLVFNTQEYNYESISSLYIKNSEIYIGTGEGVFISTNNGKSWEKRSYGLPYDDIITAITIKDTNIFIGTNLDGVYLSTNKGRNWKDVSNGLFEGRSVYSFTFINNSLFVGTEWYSDIFLTTNNGLTWSDVTDNLVSSSIYCLTLKDRYIFAGTHLNGIWRRPLSEMITLNSIQGKVYYANKDSTEIKKTRLYLINGNSERVDSTFTDSVGHYVFNNVVNDNYTIEPKITLAWGGVNTTDALLINRGYIGLYSFIDNLLRSAADVTGDGKINPTDALFINRRYIVLINKYKVSDWLWEKPVITVNGDDVIQNIKVVCAGDVNGSYKF